MLLPNGEQAIVDVRKLRDYCLNPDNPRGAPKARVFSRALGITRENADELRHKLLKAAATVKAQEGELDLYGQRYTIDFEMVTDSGAAMVRSGWIILRGEAKPRLTTCYVTKRS